jgi:phage tail sheath protein FI
VSTKYFTGYENGGYFRPPHPPGANPEEITLHQEKLFGLAAYEAVEEIGLVVAPDLIIPDFYAAAPINQIPEQGIIFASIPEERQTFESLKAGQIDLLSHCQKMGERFAILDSPRGAEIGKGDNRIEEWPSNFQLFPSSRYGALYYPWIRQKAADFDGRELFIPPSGHAAGIYSRTEQRRGVGKAPANEILYGAVELEFCLNDAAQAILNPRGVNCLRMLPGRGPVVWGSRTLSLDPMSMYVNVRRVALAVIKNILVNMRGVVFEPNDVKLWNNIVSSLRLFFLDLFQSGALAGTRPEEAFFVKCDEETNPPETVDQGMVITQVGFAPARPAEFILVTIKRSADSLSVRE